MRRFFPVVLLAGAAPLTATMAARAGEIVPGHPRISEVDRRLENQQGRIGAGVKDGQINAKQESRDEKTDARVARK